MENKSGRNVYVDFFRGLGLLWIFIDHTPWDWLSNVTFRRIGFCDALELFVLLAGFSVSYAYGAVLFRRGAMAAAEKVLRRAGTISIANVILYLVLRAEAAVLKGSETGRSVLDFLGLNELKYYSAEDVGDFTDILSLYIVLFLIVAVVLPMLRYPRALLSLSVALYAATYLFGLHIPGMYLNPLAWQVLLMMGAVLVIEPSVRPAPHPAWDVAAMAIVLAALGMQVLMYLAQHHYAVAMAQTSPLGPVTTWIQDTIKIDSAKRNLHPLRLVNIVAWAWLAYRFAPFYRGWLDQFWARPFILCGRHSLPVFCFGIFLAPLGGVWLATWTGREGQIAYNVTGAVILVTVAALAAAYKSWQQQSRALLFSSSDGYNPQLRVRWPSPLDVPLD